MSKGLHIMPSLIATAFFMQMLDGTILNTALPAIAASIGENPLNIQSIIIAYIVTVAFFLPLSGWLSDRFGTRRVFMTAIAVFSLGSLCCAVSGSLYELLLSRILQGIGGALLVPVGRLQILRLYPRRFLVPILSFVVIPGMIGPLIGPVLGGFLVQYASWHWIFLINLPVGIVSFAVSYIYMPDRREKNPPSFDSIGFILFSAFIILFSLSLDNTPIAFLEGKRRSGMLIASLLLLLGSWRYFKRKKEPLFDLRIFSIRTFSIGLLNNFCARISVAAIPFLGPLMLQVGLGFSAAKAGLIMLIIGVSGIAAKSMAPQLIKRFGFKTYLISVSLGISLFVGLASLIGPETPVAVIVILFGLFGIVNSLQFTGLTTMTLSDLSGREASSGNTLLSIVMQLSMSAGIGIAAIILDSLTRVWRFEEISAFQCTYIILALASAATTLTYLLLPKRHN